MIQKAILKYLKENNYSSIQLKAVLFDMDGVLFNSMPYHAEAWYQTMTNRGLNFSKEEAYLHEGRTGAGTINIAYQRQLGRNATEEEINSIYKEKSEAFNKNPEAERMSDALELINKIKKEKLTIMVVTGSGQSSLLDRLDANFPNTFKPELMVTAFDVKHGKPNPEPYLMALEKANVHPNEAIVIENAPLGVEAGVAAGIFTIAVNTGPLDDEILVNKGANLLFSSMKSLEEKWEELFQAFSSCYIK